MPKQGFGSPINTWLRGELRGLSENLLLNSSLVRDGLFNREYIQEQLAGHASGKVNNGNRIWSLINLETWYRINFSDRQPEETKENLKGLYQSWASSK